jgi:hypothetical protein
MLTQTAPAELDKKECCSAPTVFWLGAGFSICATSNQLPGMRNYFDRLTPNTYPKLDTFLRERFGDPKVANVEEALILLDQLQYPPFTGAALRNVLHQQNPVAIKKERNCLASTPPAGEGGSGEGIGIGG